MSRWSRPGTCSPFVDLRSTISAQRIRAAAISSKPASIHQCLPNQISDLVEAEAYDEDCDSRKKAKIFVLQYHRRNNRKHRART
jgi:hypothetical protein